MDVNSIALSGLRASETRIAVTANNTANATTPGFKAQQTQQTARAGGGVDVDVVDTQNEVSLDQEVANSQIASYDFKANIKVLQKQQEMDKSLLDIQA